MWCNERQIPGRWAIIGILCLGALHVPQRIACGSEPTVEISILKRAIVTNYAEVLLATYQDSLTALKKLETSVNAFLAEPSLQGLTSARNAWLAARIPYSQTETARFYDGPIDQIEGRINSWPIDEHYIDYVSDNPDAGIINETTKFPAVTRKLIVSLNEKEGKKNISAGFHAIEFLLWGQDLSATGPGERPWKDFANGTKNAERRREYLRITVELLVENIGSLVEAWSDGNAANYRSEFVAMDPDVALASMLKGMGALSGPELAGERLTVPYETKEQEEEQDCFSDNTRDDITYDAIGIQNVYLGRYQSVSGKHVNGPGLHDLLRQVDLDFADKLAAQVETAVACARKIPQPFDQAILGANTSPGRMAIKNAINAFQTESDSIARAAKVLSIQLSLK